MRDLHRAGRWEPVLSCLALPVECQEAEILTVEGMAGPGGCTRSSRRSRSWGAAQCGYCTPGILLTARALIDTDPRPTRDEIRVALAGNLCRWTGYTKILDAIELAAGRTAKV